MSGRKSDGRGLRNRQPFAVTVEFLSDWACGTGTTRYGAVDREVHRDQDGLPMLRGKTLVGMLRDAAETVVEGLDEGRDGLWHGWLRVLFGDRSGAHGIPGARPGPLPAALVAHPLRLPEPVREALANLDELSRHLARDATVTLRPGVQIDPNTGVAADEMFRVEERASAGLVVTADWLLSFDMLPPDAPVPWEAEFLLRAAARLVDAAGGKRRRGAGRCRVEIAPDGASGDASGGASDGASNGTSDRPVDRLTELLALVDDARPPQVALPAAANGGSSAQPSDAGTVGSLGERRDDILQHRYDLRITALTPLLFVRGEIGNLVHTERFIPGTALLPALHVALGDQATELITSGQAIVTNATVEINGRRSLPTPMALQQEKGRPDSALVNLLVPPSEGRDDDRRLRPWGGFCVVTEAGIRRATPKLVEWAHASIDDEPQRPTEDTGGFFVYEAIATGTVLRAEVWLPADVSLDTARLAGRRRIGRSRKDDYGLVDIEVATPDPAARLQTGVAGPDADRPGELVVWLLSDVLLRGSAGEPAADVGRFAEVLGEALGVELRLPDVVDDAAEAGSPPGALVTFRRVESWQRRWSLPRPSLIGLGAGSVLRFQMVGTPPSAEAYRRVEACGIGERTAEGFGRVALAPELLTRETVALAPPASSPVSSSDARSTGGGAPGAVPPLVVDLLIRGWSRELRRRVRERVKDPAVRGRLVPDDVSAAQLGTVRTIADRLAADDDPSALLGWIKATRNVLKRSAAWGTDRLDLLDRLADGADPELWNLLGVSLPLGVPEVAVALHRPAYAWLLAEAAREQTVICKGRGDVDGRMEARA